MKNRIYVLFLLVCYLSSSLSASVKKPVDYVNNRIGNISILLMPTYPTTHLPNSMLRMIPSHDDFLSDRMRGFPLNIPMYRQGDVLRLMPFCCEEQYLNPEFQYRYDQEKSTPYNYSVRLDDYDITVKFAPAEKSAIYSFTFENNAPRYLLLRTVDRGELQITNNNISGYENYKGIKHYFYLEFEQTPIQTESNNKNGYDVCYARFDDNIKTVNVRYGISYISIEQAKKNLNKEIPDYNLARLERNARNIWNKTLGKIEIEGDDESQKTTFYTALYRAHERMINISEDGKYFSGFDRKIHDDEGVPFWTDDWVWDTFLALHPLQTILSPKEQEQKIASYIRMCEQSNEKWMPTFPCVYGDVHCMNGNHIAGVFADALSKGLNFDVEKAFEGIKNTVLNETMIPWRRSPKTELDDFYHKNGWFPALPPNEKETIGIVSDVELRQAVAVTQAASYDDWCIAQLAHKLAKKDDYDFFIKRSFNYRNLFNKETGFFHPKDKYGKFIEPFDYKISGGYGSRAYYGENNAWTYIWDVHHNIPDLINLFGGNKQFIEKLDQLFVEDLGRARWLYYASHPDATGNIGQYVAGNEPSFHIPYLYNYAGEPWKAQKRIRMILESWFRNDLMGIPGDEDGGAMCAYYVFSAMGFYPVTSGIPTYDIGSPMFKKVTIHLENGKTFTIKATNASWENKYIQSAKLNGKTLDEPRFSHDIIVNGGVLELKMGNRPNKTCFKYDI